MSKITKAAAELGRKGGKSLASKKGSDYMLQIGSSGGKKSVEKRGFKLKAVVDKSENQLNNTPIDNQTAGMV